MYILEYNNIFWNVNITANLKHVRHVMERAVSLNNYPHSMPLVLPIPDSRQPKKYMSFFLVHIICHYRYNSVTSYK